MSDRGYGCNEGGKFNDFSKAYKKTPSIENYVKLRRKSPHAEIEVAVIGGFERLFCMQHVFQRYGLDTNLVAKAMDADADSISELALQIMEKLIERRRLEKSGKRHLVRRGLAVPDKLVDWIITCSLDALSWNDELYIPRDLIVLIRERLGGSHPEYEQASKAYEFKGNAGMIAGQLKAQGVNPTFKILGGILKVSPSTVKRWFKPQEFERERDRWASFFDSEGNLLSPIASSLRKK